MDGFHVQHPVLDEVASLLGAAGDRLEGAAAPPPAPDVGDLTGSVTAVLSLLTGSIGGLVEGLGVVGTTVDECAGSYVASDVFDGPAG
jgi:hypothetical protein